MISFGPVPSRRLGKSLGINNIVTPKVCSYNCIYCQVGKTRKQSTDLQEFFTPEVILEDVKKHLAKIKKNNYPDYLTFVSNGEPTLDINLGKSIKSLKSLGVPVAVLTNASLLFLESVRNDLSMADWVSLKMDAGDENTWHTMNLPAPGLNFGIILNSINKFANEYKGILRTETMLVKGINDSAENLTNLARLIKKIKPGKAYLSVPTRPPLNKNVKAPDLDKLNEAWQVFDKIHIKTELLTGFEGIITGYTGNIYEDILNITTVHPLREDSLLNLLHNDNADFSVVKSLISQRLIRSTIFNGEKYYLREYHIKY